MEISRSDDEGREGVVNDTLKESALVVGNDGSSTRVTMFTPDKTNKLLHTGRKEGSVQLPEKYKTLVELFNRMVCSLRLLGLQKISPTFKNICTMVEVLTRRKLSYNHLAQMKHILPEALKIKKISVHDEKSLCVKPEISVTLLFDVVEGHQEKSAFIALRHLFHMKVLSFTETNPEDSDIPEGTLPLSSNQINQTTSHDAVLPSDSSNLLSPVITSEALPADSLESQQTSVDADFSSGSLHQNSPIKRHFSSKIPLEDAQKTELSISTVCAESSTNNILSVESVGCEQQIDCSELCSKSTLTEAPQPILPQYSPSPTVYESPLAKLTSAPIDSVLETPAQLTPQRSVPRGDDNVKSFSSKKGASGQKPTKRYIDFSHLEGDESRLHSTTNETQGNEVVSGCTSLHDKEMPASLQETVIVIPQIFKFLGRASITKDELVHKIMMNNFEITERREIEEQLGHLEKQVPDWLCRRETLSGDIIYSISKAWDLDAVRARLHGI